MSKDEQAWVDVEKEKVLDFLESESIEYNRISDFPVFYVFPDIALWAVESKEAPGWVAWWVLSGDCPTDYIGSDEIRHPAEALLAFAELWHEAADYILRGESHPHFSLESAEEYPDLGELLRDTATQLEGYANDDEIWE